MFLIRTAFWLMILILLLPNDEQQQSQVYGTAQAAVKDVSSFCDRNPEVCAKGKDAFGVFVHKAQFGAAMLMGFIKDKAGAGATDPATPDAAAPASWKSSESLDTLDPDDLEPAWGGSREAGT
jgi:Family of unknown function (DUF5330)